MLQKGDKAPYFEGTDQDGNIIRLSDFAGRRLVLYFYPTTMKDSSARATPWWESARTAWPRTGNS